MPAAGAQQDSDLVRQVIVRSFADAEPIGRAFRDDVAILVDLARAPRDQARRVLDFCAGLVFGLHGSMEKLGPGRFFLTPEGVDLPASLVRELLGR